MAAVLTGGVSEIVIFVVKNWDEIKVKTKATWDAVLATTQQVWSIITEFFARMWNTIKARFSAGLDAVDRAWTNTWNTIKNLVTDGIQAVAGIFQGGVSIIGGVWRSIWDNVVNILDGIFGTVRSMVDSVISWVQRAIDRINIFKQKQASVGAGYSAGGFTMGAPHQIAGVVHGGEWVAPVWMVDKYAGVISQLESARMRGYESGGFVRSSNTTNNNQRHVQQTITQHIREGVDFSIAARELSWRARFA